MKIVFVVSKFPCYDEAFILRELHALSKQADIRIFSLRKSSEKTIHDEAKELLRNTIYVPYLLSWEIIRSNASVFLRYPLRYVSAFWNLVFGNIRCPEFLVKNLAFFPKAIYLADLVEKEGIDHIHAYWATYPTSLACVVSQITRKPYSFTGHAHDIYLNTTNLKQKIMHAKFIATCAESNKHYLQSIAPKYPSEQILIIRHGINLETFRAESKAVEPIEILSVGTLQWHKGFEYFIEALGKLKERGVPFHATIIGGGSLAEDLEEHIRLLQLRSFVTMTGPLKQDKVIPYYKQAHIKVLMAQPEWHWGIPNVFIEASAAGAVVVTTKFGSVEELIKDGQSGVIVPSKDSTRLADELEKLIRDQELRGKLARAAHAEVAEHFDLAKNVGQYMAWFGKGKKVCHLIWALEPGGAERQVVTIAKWQKAHGYDPMVVCLTRKGSLASELESVGIPVFLIEKASGLDFSVVGKLARFLKSHVIEILQTHIPTAGLWGRLAAMRAGGCRVIVTEHSDMAVQDIRFRLLNLLLAPWTNHFLVVSEHIRNMMIKTGISPKKISVVHNGIVIERSRGVPPTRLELSHGDIRSELGIPSDAVVVGTVGRLEPRKDHKTLIEACKRIQKEIPKAHFVIVGDGPCRNSVESEIREAGFNGSIHLLGTRNDVDRLLEAMDVFVLSSLTEGISAALLEAMIHGKACVATNVGGNPEVISDDVNGKLVPSQRADLLAQAVLELLANQNKRVALGAMARQTVLVNFSVETMMKGFEEVYAKVLN